jgi:hypothetical protein
MGQYISKRNKFWFLLNIMKADCKHGLKIVIGITF